MTDTPLLPDPLPVIWQKDGAEWESHLSAVLRQGAAEERASGRRHFPRPPERPYEIIELKVASLSSSLRLTVAPDGVRASVASDGVPPEDDLARWRAAVEEATTRVGRHKQMTLWTGVLAAGPRPEGVELIRLSPRTFTIGTATIDEQQQFYVEYVRGGWGLPSIHAAGLWQTVPVFVNGQSTAYDVHSGLAEAAVELQLIRAVLSLATSVHYLVLEAPRDVVKFGLPAIPERHPIFGPKAQALPAASNERVCTVPEWVPGVAERVRAHEAIPRALLAYLEGLDLLREHPSFAVVAFVTVIEGIGSMLEPLTRCPCCDKCAAQVGAGRRFRRALRDAISQEEVKHLAEAYSVRSDTAHSGLLFGFEPLGGMTLLPIGFLQPAPARLAFTWQFTRRVRAAAEAVLRHQLGADDAHG